MATRVRATTQRDALRLFQRHRRATGLRWWSTIEASWINLTIFDRARRRLRVRSVDERPVPLQVDGDYIGEETEAVFGLKAGGLHVVA